MAVTFLFYKRIGYEFNEFYSCFYNSCFSVVEYVREDIYDGVVEEDYVYG